MLTFIENNYIIFSKLFFFYQTGVTRYVAKEEIKSFGSVQKRKEAFSSHGIFGAHLRCLNMVVIVDDDVFVHASLLPQWLNEDSSSSENDGEDDGGSGGSGGSGSGSGGSGSSGGSGGSGGDALDRINEKGRVEMFKENWNDPLFKSEGPLWTRELARGRDAKIVCNLLSTVLKRLNVTRMIVGHTVQRIRVGTRCSGRLVLLDTGMSSAYDGNPAVMIIKNYDDEKGNEFLKRDGTTGIDSSSVDSKKESRRERETIIIYPEKKDIRSERMVILEKVAETKVLHEEMLEEHRLSQSDSARRNQIKKNFFLNRDDEKKKEKRREKKRQQLRHEKK